jgi:hypothetical protein
MTKCICVIQNGERFAHGHCLAFHDKLAVGHVVDPQTLTVQHGSIFDAPAPGSIFDAPAPDEVIARLQRTHRELGRLVHGNVTTAEFEAGLVNALCEIIEVMLEERVP